MSDQTTLALTRATEELSPNYTVWIEAVDGSLCAGWTGPDGCPHVMDGDGYLADDINEAVDGAVAHAAEIERNKAGEA